MHTSNDFRKPRYFKLRRARWDHVKLYGKRFTYLLPRKEDVVITIPDPWL